MSREGAVPDRFKGLKQPASLESDHILLDHVTLGRLCWSGDERGVPLQMEQSDGYLLCYQRKYLRAPVHWGSGSRLFLDQLTLALMSHLMCVYGERTVKAKPITGGL